MAETIQPIYRSTRHDLLYAILLKLGGTMLDIENLYSSTDEDLLYAILKNTTGVTELTNQQTGSTIAIAAKSFIRTLIFESATTQNIKVGTTNGGGEIFDDIVTANITFEAVINTYFKNATTLYITAVNPFTLTIIK